MKPASLCASSRDLHYGLPFSGLLNQSMILRLRSSRFCGNEWSVT